MRAHPVMMARIVGATLTALTLCARVGADEPARLPAAGSLGGITAPAPGGARSPHKGAVASAYPLASEAGQEMLAKGGNAFDAAVAVSAALAVVEPTSSGLGGGGFYLLHRASDRFETLLDAREKAPVAASRDMYLDASGTPIPHASTVGPRAAAIPGEPAAFEYLAQHFGKLPLSVSLAPAIRLAREGFPLYPRLEGAIRYKREALLRSPDAAKVFLTADGQVPALGTRIRQPDLARTLEAMAAQGARGFYGGRVAEDLVAGVRAGGGIWTLADLADYRVIERKPLVGHYHGARIVSASPPSSGGVALLDALNILSGYDLRSAGSTTRKHLIIEAMQRAYRDRAVYLGDPDFVSMPLAQLTSEDYAAGQRSSIRLDRAMPSAALPGVEPAVAGMHTTHLSVLDAQGNEVAGTISINLFFGSGDMIARTGVLLNDTMDDFSIKPNTPNAFGLVGNEQNAIAPGKRPLSSMTPTFVDTGHGEMIIGTPGGSYIISMVLLGTLDYLDGMSAAAIVADPRFHHQYLPDVVEYESGAFSAAEVSGLETMGHTLEEGSRRWGNMEVITWDFSTGNVQAASDPRGEGSGLVY
jgi:gamma-glutamyltranspeptidase/glutathione hydrolase